MYEPSDPDGEHRGRTALRRRGASRWIVAVVLVAAAVVAAVWLLGEQPPEPQPTGGAAPAPAPPAPEPPLPPPSAATAREFVEAISANPLFRRATTGDDLSPRVALVLSSLANGESPRKPLAALAPGKPFSVVTRDGATFIAHASYARYDAFATAVGSVDAQKLAVAYRALRGPIEAALRALGYPEARLDDFTGRALRRITSAPVRDSDVEVVGVRGFYAFADAKLEQLDEVQKHLLRMGPRNTRVIQDKARELQRVLGPGVTGG
jgi:hypothetical protein